MNLPGRAHFAQALRRSADYTCVTDRTRPGRRALVGVALTVALALGAPAPVAAHRPLAGTADAPRSTATAAHPLRVMFVGDSMTQGRPGSATYRYWMWRGFQEQGVPARFVGPRTDVNTTSPAMRHAYEHLDHGFADQLAHEAQGGSEIAYHLAMVTRVVTAYRPDVLVFQVGFNDTDTSSAARIAADTAEYLRRVWAADPAIRVVLGEIPPSAKQSAFDDVRRARSVEANQLIAAAVAGDDRVAIAHHATHPFRPWNPVTDTFDAVHPNAVGETLFAQRFAEALVELGVFTKPVRLYHHEPWTPRLPVRATSRRHGIEANLSQAAWFSRAGHTFQTRVRVYQRARGGWPVVTTPWSPATRVHVRIRPGRYWVEPVVRRSETQVSRPGGRVAVTVSR